MNVLVVVTHTNLGGVTSSAYNLSNELIERGHSITFLDLSGKFYNDELLNIQVQRMKLTGIAKYWNITASKKNNLSFINHKVLGYVKKTTIRSGLWYKIIFNNVDIPETFDVAIAFQQCEPCYYFVLNCINAKKKMGFVHGELKYMGDISSWQKYMSSFDKIAYVSNAVKDEFIAAYPELSKNACTIYNMFDIDRIKSFSKEDCPVLFDKKKINIVTVARIDNDFKRIHWIPEICSKLKSLTDIPFHWYVVGDGPDFKHVNTLSQKKNIQDVLSFLGDQKNPYNILKHADFSVLLSKSEAYGMVVIESFILGVPIVVTEYPALCEIMNNDQQGIISNGDIKDICTAILDMLHDKNYIRTRSVEILSNTDYNNDIAYNQFLEAIQDEKKEKGNI